MCLFKGQESPDLRNILQRTECEGTETTTACVTTTDFTKIYSLNFVSWVRIFLVGGDTLCTQQTHVFKKDFDYHGLKSYEV